MNENDNIKLLKKHCPGVLQRRLRKFFKTDVADRYLLLFGWSANKIITFSGFKFFVNNIKANSDLSDVVLSLSPDKEMHNKHFKHVINEK
jgi:hypothetical protein